MASSVGAEPSALLVFVDGAREAYVDIVEGQQVLLVRKDDTRLTLVGLPAADLYRIAGGLRAVEAAPHEL